MKIGRILRVALVAMAMFLCTPAVAHADPITGAIVAVATAIGSAAAAVGAWWSGLSGLLQFAIGTVLSTGLSYLQRALQGVQQSATGVKGQIQGGGEVPRSFIAGTYATPGSLVYAGYWGNAGGTPNSFLTYVIALSDLPVSALRRFAVNGTWATYNPNSVAKDWGFPVPEYIVDGKQWLWIRFHDGTQTAADPWLVSQFGSDTNYPYGANRIGYGIAYAIVTARVNPKLFQGFPQYLFELDGIKLYDVSKDTSAGGNGTQSFGDPSTWTFSNTPQVAKYNVLRGIFYRPPGAVPAQWVYGLQKMTAARLPAANWIAAINACRLQIANSSGQLQDEYRFGAEIAVNVEPADTIEELDKACNGRTAEIGGRYKTRTGAAGAAIYSFTDNNILISEGQSYEPFPSLSKTINAINATYPEPSESWNTKDAPAVLKASLETADGGRRLVSQVQYQAVPYVDQVQRLMQSALQEARKFRNHDFTLPPTAQALEPLDIVSYTSVRNGYQSKLFEIVGGEDKANLDVEMLLSEVDPSDYDFNPVTDYLPVSIGSLVSQTPLPLSISGLTVQPVTVPGDSGMALPGIRLSWNTADIDGIEAIEAQVKLSSDGTLVSDLPYIRNWQSGFADIAGHLLPATNYLVRVRYISPTESALETVWSAWLPVTTPDVRIAAPQIRDKAIDWPALSQSVTDLQTSVGKKIAEFTRQAEDLSRSVAETGLGSGKDLRTLHIDSIPDGATYARPLGAVLSGGRVVSVRRPLAGTDISPDDASLKTEVTSHIGGLNVSTISLNSKVTDRTADNIAESVARKWAAESGADVTAGKAFSTLAGRTADFLTYTGGATVDSLKPAEAGADVTAGKSLTVLANRTMDGIADTASRRALSANSVQSSDVVVGATSKNSSAKNIVGTGVPQSEFTQILFLSVTPENTRPIVIGVVIAVNTPGGTSSVVKFRIKVAGGQLSADLSNVDMTVIRDIDGFSSSPTSFIYDSLVLTEIPKATLGNITVTVEGKWISGSSVPTAYAFINSYHFIR